MLFLLITIVFGFIALIAFFGDYQTKELQKDIKTFEKITGHKYK